MKRIEYKRLNPPERTLIGTDLSNASPRARQGLIACLQGATDPSFLDVLNLAQDLLRDLWRTENQDTFIFPGTEEAGMEAVLVNLLEPDDIALVGVAGYGGQRLADAAERTGARVIRLEVSPGHVIPDAMVEAALKVHKPRLVGLVHGEASTGVHQSLANIARLAHQNGALCVADVCSTTALVEVKVDEWGLDACWSGSQKGLSAYPGLALVTFGTRAADTVRQRKTPVRSYYFELDGLRSFAKDERRHQTFPAPLLYALTEVLQLAYEQSMTYRVSRHINRRDALVAALETLGLEVLAPPENRLASSVVVLVPNGIDADKLRQGLLTPYRLDVGSGLGALKGKALRFGIQSHSAQPGFLIQAVAVLEYLLAEQGYTVPKPGAAVDKLLGLLDP